MKLWDILRRPVTMDVASAEEAFGLKLLRIGAALLYTGG